MGTGLELAAVAALAGGVLQAGSQLSAGNAAAKQGAFQKQQADIAANNAMGAAERKSIDTRRQTNLVQSRLQALSAAGGGASDPTVVNLSSNIAGEGEYRALTDLYNGQTQADDLTNKGNIALYEGKAKKSASKMAALGTILGTGGSLFAKYGGGGMGSSSGFGNIPGTGTSGGWSSTPYAGTDITWNNT